MGEFSHQGCVHLVLKDVDATEQLGAQLADVAQAGDVIFLSGELGAGKTSLARGFLRHYFQDPALEVPSPSYLICFGYSDETEADPPIAAPLSSSAPALGRSLCPRGKARVPGVRVLHLDPYRLPEGRVAGLIDLPSAFISDVCLVEWPERLGSQLRLQLSERRWWVVLNRADEVTCERVAQQVGRLSTVNTGQPLHA